MKNSLYFLIVLFSMANINMVYSQAPDLNLTVEYTPHISNISNPVLSENSKLSHMGFLRLDMTSERQWNATIGLGFLNTGNKSVRQNNFIHSQDIDQVQFNYNYNYVVLSGGLRFNLHHGFNMLAELGMGYSIEHRVKQTIMYVNGEIENSIFNEGLNNGSFNTFTVPFLLSINKEFSGGNLDFILGLKGYVGLTEIVRDVPRSNHMYGIGLTFGLRI